jgi:NAD(P)-dependent dehydrogenase (short-subunit alcohol dehydrogenase family)
MNESAGPVVVVGGGAGGIGEKIVHDALAAGYRTVATSRTDSRLGLLRAALPDAGDRLTVMRGDVGDEADCARLRDAIVDRFGRIDVLVASLGGWWTRDSLLDVELAEWSRVMHEMLTTHFIFARTFVPVLIRQGFGRYIGIGGGAALVPIPGSSIVSIAGAAQLMMTRALRAECTSAGVTICELLVNGPVFTRETDPETGSGWITAGDVAATTVELMQTGATTWPGAHWSGPVVQIDPKKAAGQPLI